MWWIALGFDASAHPPLDGGQLSADAHERLVAAVLEGPMGCFQSEGTVRWSHRAGSASTSGEARVSWRFDHRVWRMDDRTLLSADRGSLGVVIAPMLFGRAVAVDLSYPTTRGRQMDWPAPVATLPVRLFGEVGTVSVDELADGTKRIVESFLWDGWKHVEGTRSITFADRMSPRTAGLDATDRWRNGCRVRSVGEAELAPGGLPRTERWTLDGRCALRTWSAEWSFLFDGWRPCAFSGPADGGTL